MCAEQEIIHQLQLQSSEAADECPSLIQYKELNNPACNTRSQQSILQISLAPSLSNIHSKLPGEQNATKSKTLSRLLWTPINNPYENIQEQEGYNARTRCKKTQETCRQSIDAGRERNVLTSILGRVQWSSSRAEHIRAHHRRLCADHSSTIAPSVRRKGMRGVCSVFCRLSGREEGCVVHRNMEVQWGAKKVGASFCVPRWRKR